MRPLLVVLTAVFVVTACGGSTAAPAVDNSPADVKIMVGGINKQIYIPNKLTEILGYFKEQNLNVTLIDEGSGQASEEEVIAGNVDGGSGSFSHVLELQPKGKFMTQVVQFQIAPGEAEMVDAKKADSIKTAADLKGKNLGVTSLGSGTHTITLALLGRAGLSGTDAKFVAVGAGNTFIAAIQQQRIDAGMTTEPTISRLIKTGAGKVLIDLRTPEATRAALGADYPFIGIFMMTAYVNAHKNVVQRLVNAYVKTLKWMKSHSAQEISDKMPADYYAGDKDMYVTALAGQKDSFTADGIMPSAGAQNALQIELNYVKDMKGATVDLSKTYTNDFAKAAK
ncbi:MAG TPA: ABC transporter substrate-binding protein [Candidatus Dormibacteraeota bacterium]|jgi:NitT/TauT family transport system substrate-binding protein